MYLFIVIDPSSQEREDVQKALNNSIQSKDGLTVLRWFYSLFHWLCFKQAFVHKAVMDEMKRIIEDSEVCPFKFVFVFVLLRYTREIYTSKYHASSFFHPC